MSARIYKKGATVFIEKENETIRIPSMYTAYEVKNEQVIIHDLVNDKRHFFPESGIESENGTKIDYVDSYLCEFIGA